MNRWIVFMANDKSLISFSLISSSWETYHKDTFDMLAPFVFYYIKDKNLSTDEYITIPETKKYLINEFGIEIYSNVLEIVFKRLRNEGYLKKKNKSYIITSKEINISEFKSKREIYKTQHQMVLDSFFTFLKEKEIEFKKDVATNAMISYLCKYGKEVISGNVEDPIANGDVWQSRVGRFVSLASESNDNIFECIQSIAKGGMISSVIFQNGKDFKESKKFKNTKIYFDTSLLMHILGYSGEVLKESVKEMATLLEKHGAKLCYFQHNKMELEGILNAYIKLYNNHKLDTSYNFDYFIENDIKPEKITEYIVLLEKNLKLEHLTMEDTPDYSEYERNIDWTSFSKYIIDNILYNDLRKRDNDVQSIAAIYRLRKYEKYTNYESCNALFVTTNSSLAYFTKKIF